MGPAASEQPAKPSLFPLLRSSLDLAGLGHATIEDKGNLVLICSGDKAAACIRPDDKAYVDNAIAGLGAA